MKKLILRENGVNNFLIRHIEGYDIDNYYRINVNGILFKIIKKIKIKILYSLILKNWKKNINLYDTIILFDYGYTTQITEYIKKKNNKCKIILWLWNPISNYILNMCFSDHNLDEIWSYDKNDCKKYGLKYNSQFYNKNIIFENGILDTDILFLGSDKGRKEAIDSYEKIFKANGLKTNFKIITKKSDYVQYTEYLKMISNSRCILDIVHNNVSGLTLRCMESIFLNKKLITNNTDIINYDFYNSSNIFVIGVDDFSTIKEFVYGTYQKLDEKILSYYDYENWLKRFDDK